MSEDEHHGPDEPNPPDPVDPRLMKTPELKRAFRVAMRDIRDGRGKELECDSIYDVSGEREAVFDLAMEAERELRKRGYDPEVVAESEIIGDPDVDHSGADE